MEGGGGEKKSLVERERDRERREGGEGGIND